MAKKMLIDATQAEETRVAVIDGNRLDELDFEIASRKQLKGNIYLAKVAHVEPSLQAAFVEYGGNRHGFLAFAEIHPDYYKIPVADKEKLLELERELEREEAEREEAEEAAALAQGVTAQERMELLSPPAPLPIQADDVGSTPTDDVPAAAPPADLLLPELEPLDAAPLIALSPSVVEGEIASSVEDVPAPPPVPRAEESDEDADRRRLARRRAALLRQYKIQEVIKRNQILLIQVVKEERGNKGAALTTYLSLAGRYCVLMPNTNRGGGVSRKINSMEERRRMKSLLSELDLPEGMSVILRTAGLERSKTDIRRDLEYVMRLWDSIREKTLSSTAPSLIHEEANLIRRAIRDLYSRDVAEIQVEGDSGYHTAKEFMRLIMPSAARRVHHYRDPAVPLFVRHRIESQIEALYTTTVTLKSGGYLVINQTEALVAIDVNSGRSTRERNIEETALRTNLEAAEEIARQLRLRDLAGLIVIDFIDMEDARHNAQVERKVRDAMKNDRARIQLGRISMFGLMELSRQRLRPSLIETNFSVCQACGGMGHTRSVESAALHVLRSIEEEGLQQKASEIAINVAEDVALYLLNHKRAAIGDIERRYGIKIFVHSDSDLKSGEHKLERLKARQPGEFQFPEPPPPIVEDEPDLPPEEENEGSDESAEDGSAITETGGDAGERRRGRAGGRTRGGRNRNRGRGDRATGGAGYPDVSQPGAPQPEIPLGVTDSPANGEDSSQPATIPPPPTEDGYVPLTAHEDRPPTANGEENGDARRRRRGRRGGRGRNRGDRFDRPERGERPEGMRPETGLPGDGQALPPPRTAPEGNSADLPPPVAPPAYRSPPREQAPRNVPPAPPPASGSHGGIRIVTEIRARSETAPAAPPSASAPAVSSPPATDDTKPKSGWWKRLMGSSSE